MTASDATSIQQVDKKTAKLTVIPASTIKGDANNDGEVNGMDVIAVYNVMLGNTDKTAAADVNNDGEVNGMDVIAIYNAMLGN
jgi:TPP-dependent pyruvate/acetoin dehydrogenase alpha subunit